MTDSRLDQLASALADRVLTRIETRLDQLAEPHHPQPLITAAEVARWLGVTRSTVYELADELGAVRLGGGDRPRLRFDPARVHAYVAATDEPEAERTLAIRATRMTRRDARIRAHDQEPGRG